MNLISVENKQKMLSQIGEVVNISIEHDETTKERIINGLFNDKVVPILRELYLYINKGLKNRLNKQQEMPVIICESEFNAEKARDLLDSLKKLLPQLTPPFQNTEEITDDSKTILERYRAFANMIAQRDIEAMKNVIITCSSVVAVLLVGFAIFFAFNCPVLLGLSKPALGKILLLSGAITTYFLLLSIRSGYSIYRAKEISKI